MKQFKQFLPLILFVALALVAFYVGKWTGNKLADNGNTY